MKVENIKPCTMDVFLQSKRPTAIKREFVLFRTMSIRPWIKNGILFLRGREFQDLILKQKEKKKKTDPKEQNKYYMIYPAHADMVIKKYIYANLHLLYK